MRRRLYGMLRVKLGNHFTQWGNSFDGELCVELDYFDKKQRQLARVVCWFPPPPPLPTALLLLAITIMASPSSLTFVHSRKIDTH